MTSRAWLGLAFLLASTTTLLVAVGRAPGAGTLGNRLWDHLWGRMAQVEVSFTETPNLRIGDPVYTVDGQAFSLVGRVRELALAGRQVVLLDVDPMILRSLGTGTRASAMTPDQDLAWILRTLVPPDLRRRVLEELRVVWDAEKQETIARLKPALTELLKDLAEVLGETLPEVLERHKDELAEIARIVKQEIYAHELQPVVKETWLPALETQLLGTASEIGSDIASRVKWSHVTALVFSSLMRKVGLASDRTVEKRLQKLLEKAALPVLRDKVPVLARGAYEVTAETLEKQEVQAAIRKAFERLIEHPSLGSLLGKINRDWLVKNELLNKRLSAALRDPQFVELGEALWKNMEPTLEKALAKVLTRPEGDGMNHQLVRVLRRVVLKKDRRYVLLIPGPGPALSGNPSVLPGTIGRDP